MKKVTLIIAIIFAFGLIAMSAMAASGTLYQQEEDVTYDQDPVEVDAAGANGNINASWTNWKYQYGTASWSGVYAGDLGWLEESSTGDMAIEVEADIEMYMTQSISGNKIYFHLGNIYTATEDDKTAIVDGSFSSNNGMYVGITFLEKDIDKFEKDGSDNFTGVILDGMQSDHDTWRVQNNQMDVEILLSWGAGWMPPVNYGEGSHGTVVDTLWWLVDGGGAGTYAYQWRIRLLPTTDQPDGDYYLDPVVVASPVL